MTWIWPTVWIDPAGLGPERPACGFADDDDENTPSPHLTAPGRTVWWGVRSGAIRPRWFRAIPVFDRTVQLKVGHGRVWDGCRNRFGGWSRALPCAQSIPAPWAGANTSGHIPTSHVPSARGRCIPGISSKQQPDPRAIRSWRRTSKTLRLIRGLPRASQRRCDIHDASDRPTGFYVGRRWSPKGKGD